jgi:outer membrane protein assembly factor BamB
VEEICMLRTSSPRLQGGRHRSVPQSLLGALLALAVIGAAGCGTTSIHRTGPIWTPSASPAAPRPGGDWLTFDFDSARSGVNPNETAITPITVGHLHQLWTATLPKPADSTPILLHALALPDGTTRDVLYLTTKAGSLVALDATTGAILWTRTTSGPKITNASPVADPTRAYIYSYGLDGKLHRYSATSGAEARGGIWPVTITRMTQTEKESSALNAANGYVYVTTSGYIGDAPPYQGHVVAVDLAHSTIHVFNSLCSDRTHVLASGECPDEQSGIWARAGVTVDPVTGYIFATTGNGPFTANTGGHDWGDSVLELTADGSRLVDSYTPPNYAELDQGDADLGSTAPALLPSIPASHTPYLAVQAGKDGLLRLLDRQNLSGQGGPGHVGGELQSIATPGGCAVVTQPAAWTDAGTGTIWLFVTDSCGTSGYQVVTTSAGATTLRQGWSTQQGATTPVVAGGVLFAATSGHVLALDPRTGHQLWSSAGTGAGGSIGGIHWESPIVIGGRLYCSDEDGNVTAYGG